MVKLLSLSLGLVKYSFINFTFTFILTWSDSKTYGPIYGSNKTIQSVTVLRGSYLP